MVVALSSGALSETAGSFSALGSFLLQFSSETVYLYIGKLDELNLFLRSSEAYRYLGQLAIPENFTSVVCKAYASRHYWDPIQGPS